MRNKTNGFIALFLGIFFTQAQEHTMLSIEQAVQLAITQSTDSKYADTKVATKKYEMQLAKNNQYPDVKAIGQYQYLIDPDVKIKTGEIPVALPKINQVLFGQLSITAPLFSGFKIQNNIKVSQTLYEAEQYYAKDAKEQLALNVIKYYVALYKAQQMVVLLQENSITAAQRVKDFTSMEENGLIPRNDLLKAQLQLSNYEISKQEAEKDAALLNYQLATLLKLTDGVQIVPETTLFEKQNAVVTSAEITERNDLEAMRLQQQAAEASINIAKASYYPAISILAGYAALDIPHIVTATNIAHIGVGLSYDLGSVFKNSKEVHKAKSKALEVEQSLEIMTDNAKIQVKQAQENYKLALKQNKVYEEAVEQAIENFRIVKDQYEQGLLDTNALLEADVQHLQSKINQAFAKADTVEKYYDLLAATGKLTTTLGSHSSQD